MDFCGQCQRRVHNLDLMSESERYFIDTASTEKVCVSYTVRRTARIPVALGLGLAVVAGVTNAADVATSGPADGSPPVVRSADSPYCDMAGWGEIIMGGTQAGKDLQWVDDSEAKLPDKADLPDIDASTWLPTPKT